jgi:hypothetical protein
MSRTFKAELFAYLGGLTRELKGKAYGINGTTDHVPMLISLPPIVSMSEALRFLKSNSSGWVPDKWSRRRSFAWQLGYAAFSVSKSNVSGVLRYIGNQETHHRRITFKEESSTFSSSTNSNTTNSIFGVEFALAVQLWLPSTSEQR